jgi:hypothetical protein
MVFTKNIFVYTSEDDQLIPILNQSLETPFEGLTAALVWAARAEIDSGVPASLVTLGFDLKGETKHTRRGVFESVKRDFVSVRRWG